MARTLLTRIKKNVPSILFAITWLIQIIKANKGFKPDGLQDPDGYVQAFNFYLNNGFYETIANGSSYLFNSVVNIFYLLTDNVQTSFFITNLLAQLLVLIIGLFLLKEINKKVQSKYINIVMLIYLFNTLDLSAYQRSNNDVFQTAIVLGIFYYLFKVLYKANKYRLNYVFIGGLCALCTLVRPTSLIVVVVAFSAIFLLEVLKKQGFVNIVKSAFIFLLPFVVLTSMFHYPSFKEKGGFGFYNKSKLEDVNWVQRNYLGAKRMQSGELPLHKNSIWRETTFGKVRQYLKENGDNSLPKTQGQFLAKDPWLYTQLVTYNVVYSVLKMVRYYSFLLLIPLLFLFKKPLLQLDKFAIYIFMISVLVVSLICFTLMEYRWLKGYDILICISLLVGLKYFETSKYKDKLSLFVNAGLIIIAFFNFVLTFVLKSSY